MFLNVVGVQGLTTEWPCGAQGIHVDNMDGLSVHACTDETNFLSLPFEEGCVRGPLQTRFGDVLFA